MKRNMNLTVILLSPREFRDFYSSFIAYKFRLSGIMLGMCKLGRQTVKFLTMLRHKTRYLKSIPFKIPRSWRKIKNLRPNDHTSSWRHTVWWFSTDKAKFERSGLSLEISIKKVGCRKPEGFDVITSSRSQYKACSACFVECYKYAFILHLLLKLILNFLNVNVVIYI